MKVSMKLFSLLMALMFTVTFSLQANARLWASSDSNPPADVTPAMEPLTPAMADLTPALKKIEPAMEELRLAIARIVETAPKTLAALRSLNADFAELEEAFDLITQKPKSSPEFMARIQSYYLPGIRKATADLKELRLGLESEKEGKKPAWGQTQTDLVRNVSSDLDNLTTNLRAARLTCYTCQ